MPLGIAGAVEALVVVEDRARDAVELLHRGDDAPAHLRVPLEDLVLLRRDLARLREHRLGRADLADVMEDAGDADRLALGLGEPQLARDALGEERHAAGVAVRVRVLRLDGERERLHRLEEHLPLREHEIEVELREVLVLLGELGARACASRAATRMRARSSAMLKGFARYSSAPSRRFSILLARSALAVTRITGTWRRRASRRRSRRRSVPERPGIITSLTTSGGRLDAAASERLVRALGHAHAELVGELPRDELEQLAVVVHHEDERLRLPERARGRGGRVPDRARGRPGALEVQLDRGGLGRPPPIDAGPPRDPGAGRAARRGTRRDPSGARA